MGFSIKGSREDCHSEVCRQGLPSVDGGLLVNLDQAGSFLVGARAGSKATDKDWIPGVAMT